MSAVKIFNPETKLNIGGKQLSINEYIDSFLEVDGFTTEQKAEIKKTIMKL
ncbi:MAG: hypothetical protein WCP92_04635 [bacterium]